MDIKFGKIDDLEQISGKYPFGALKGKGSYFEVFFQDRKEYMRINAARTRYSKETGIKFAMRSSEGMVRVIRKS